MSSGEHYTITANSIPEMVRSLNFTLARLADRMDKIEGVRGTSTIESDLDMQSNKITDVSAGQESTDVSIVDQLVGSGPTFSGLTLTGDMATTGDIKVVDSNGTVIHSFEVG